MLLCIEFQTMLKLLLIYRLEFKYYFELFPLLYFLHAVKHMEGTENRQIPYPQYSSFSTICNEYLSNGPRANSNLPKIDHALVTQ